MKYLIGCSALLLALSATKLSADVIGNGSGCEKCAPGEFAVVNTDDVGHGRYTYTPNPTCSAGNAGDLGKAIDGIGKGVIGNYAGALRDLTDTDAFRNAAKDVHGEFGKILNGGKSDTANCQLLCNIVPLGSDIVGYSLAAGDTKDSLSRCVAGKDCPIAYSRYENLPQTTETASSKLHCVNFMNWSHNKDRFTRFVTFFKPPAKWERDRDF